MTKSEQYLNIHSDLLIKCRKGNRLAQFEIYELYNKAIFNTCYRIVNNVQDAEDIMQEAFLKAFQNLGSYKAEVSFGAWLKKIVINKSIDFLRKNKIGFSSLDEKIEQIPENEPDILWEIEESTKYEEVIREINNLPDGYKIILTLKLLEGYDHNEISEILKISSVTSRTQFIRAKKRLIENINKKQSGDETT